MRRRYAKEIGARVINNFRKITDVCTHRGNDGLAMLILRHFFRIEKMNHGGKVLGHRTISDKQYG